jgi:hypothetical protein
MCFVSIDGGNWRIALDNDDEFIIALDDTTGLQEFFRTRRIDAVMCSSSVDFPEDSGAPEGFDARAVLAEALNWADASPETNATLRDVAQVVAEGLGTPEQARLVAQAFLRLTGV